MGMLSHELTAEQVNSDEDRNTRSIVQPMETWQKIQILKNNTNTCEQNLSTDLVVI